MMSTSASPLSWSKIVPEILLLAAVFLLAVYRVVEWRWTQAKRLRVGGGQADAKDHTLTLLASRDPGQTNGVNNQFYPASDGYTPLSLRLTTLLCILGLITLTGIEVFSADPKELNTVILFAFYLYIGMMTTIAIAATAKYWRSRASNDTSALLCLAFLLYAIPRLWPSAIASPAQEYDLDRTAWITITLLGIGGILVPLFMPGIPDSEDLQTDSESTRSPFTTLTFTYISPLISLTSRKSNLSIDVSDMPPMPHSNRSEVLAAEALPKLDPLLNARRNMFWGLLSAFHVEYFFISFWIGLYVCARYGAPYAMKNLLLYLEEAEAEGIRPVPNTQSISLDSTGKQTIIFKPWLSIALLALAPLLLSIFENRYFYNAVAAFSKVENTLSQLIFEHALRIRVTGDIDVESSGDTSNKQFAGAGTVEADVETQVETAVSNDIANGPYAPYIREIPVDAVPHPHPSEPVIESASASEVVSNDQPQHDSPKESSKVVDAASDDKTFPLLGKINNMLTADIANLKNMPEALNIPSGVVQIILGIAFLYSILGWSALVGFAVLVLFAPAPTFVAKLILNAQRKRMQGTDQRVQSVVETLQVIRTIKLLAWELPVLERITRKRAAELKYMLHANLLELLMRNVEGLLPLSASLATFGTFTLVMKEPLTAARAFPSLTIFATIQELIVWQIMHEVPGTLRAKLSIDRFNEFLNKTEILSHQPLQNLPTEDEQHSNDPVTDLGHIGFNNMSFTWTNPQKQLSARQERFRLNIREELVFKTGKVNLIIGNTASGKTSMLMALLGEMYPIHHDETSWFSLPREGGIAYAPQESWVMNATIRENIVFNQQFDEQRYHKVLKACALEPDLSLWEAGDMSEVGEKGITLSGGQKARVTLARALYSKAALVLLDDPLAALDTHTAKFVVENALRGELVADRTIILVTHNVLLAGRIADYFIALGTDGRISQGSSIDAVSDIEIEAENRSEDSEDDTADSRIDTGQDPKANNPASGKLIVAEEKAVGRVEWAALMMWTGSVGSLLLWIVMVIPGALQVLGRILEPWFIGYWASQYEDRDASEVSAIKYLSIYAGIVVFQMVCIGIFDVIWTFRTLRASGIIHRSLLERIMNAPFRWLDTVPVGRIITRCTQDINAIDIQIPERFAYFLMLTINLFSLLVTTIIMTGWPALISGALVVGIGGYLAHLYLRTQLCVKRELSNAKSPVMSQVGNAVAGVVVIRAYGAQAYFRRKLRQQVGHYSQAFRTYCDLHRWIAFRVDVIGSIFAAVVASYLVYGTGTSKASASAVGFTLSLLLNFTRQIMTWVQMYNDVELDCNNLERVLDFLRIDQEPPSTSSGQPPAYWPSSGNITLENVSASYSEDGPLVLRNISVSIKSGERIGVVGRTGAGKSSIALALLRAIHVQGKVHYDGIPTDSINLQALRANITLIPQQPDLLRGSIRENLDIEGEMDDARLIDALRAAGLFSLREQSGQNTPQGNSAGIGISDNFATIGLDTPVESGGTNLSLGQRQIIALARAILRRSKILILDEATAAIDYATDKVIQKSLRTELSKDTTVITIAHRLQTIMDSDRILVLDRGEVVEFDTPSYLLSKEGGLLKGLVETSEDKEKLIAIAATTGIGDKG